MTDKQNCPLRHKNGNCLPIGGFCTAVNDSICEGLHMAYEHGRSNTQWISVNDGMPEERESLFAKFKGTSQWRNTMFERMSDDVRVAVTFTDGTRMVRHGYTVDGKWNVEKKVPSCVVTHWMPNPVLPEVNDD